MAATSPLPPPPPLRDLMAQDRIALFLDFDGTLVELAEEPDGIHVPDGLLESLRDLRTRLDGRLAIVTGRALDNFETHIGTCDLARAGSHGAYCLDETGTRLGEEPNPLPDEAVETMRRFAQERGITFEQKAHGGALHYRNHADAEQAVLDLAGEVADEYELEMKRGKRVVELTASGAHKGSAVETFMAEDRFKSARPIFIGDDLTDEDGFAGANECGGFGIAVGERESQTARYHLPDVSAVHAWLEI